jgi:hypothetical protein
MNWLRRSSLLLHWVVVKRHKALSLRLLLLDAELATRSCAQIGGAALPQLDDPASVSVLFLLDLDDRYG